MLYLCAENQKKRTMKKLVIFDLDGTLLNTIADLAQSTNHALSVLGYPMHEESAYNFMVGNGINKLFERALPEGEKARKMYSASVRNSFLTTIGTMPIRAVLIPAFLNCWNNYSYRGYKLRLHPISIRLQLKN